MSPWRKLIFTSICDSNILLIDVKSYRASPERIKTKQKKKLNTFPLGPGFSCTTDLAKGNLKRYLETRQKEDCAVVQGFIKHSKMNDGTTQNQTILMKYSLLSLRSIS